MRLSLSHFTPDLLVDILEVTAVHFAIRDECPGLLQDELDLLLGQGLLLDFDLKLFQALFKPGKLRNLSSDMKRSGICLRLTALDLPTRLQDLVFDASKDFAYVVKLGL